MAFLETTSSDKDDNPESTMGDEEEAHWATKTSKFSSSKPFSTSTSSKIVPRYPPAKSSKFVPRINNGKPSRFGSRDRTTAHLAEQPQPEDEDEALEAEIAPYQPKDDEENDSEPEFEDELHQTVTYL